VTPPADGPDRAALAAEAAELETAIHRLGTPDDAADAGTRAQLEQRVVRLCSAAQALPGAEARALSETLARLIAALDEAATRLRAAVAPGDSTPDAGTAKRAAAAYGSAAIRRRRGF